jgi:hypothetical protein
MKNPTLMETLLQIAFKERLRQATETTM